MLIIFSRSWLNGHTHFAKIHFSDGGMLQVTAIKK